ncbi:5-(carboxyamino)imidazole ribonucleotide synthase [Eupransor demetentiae]|uniref:N5-carboxyaminoimidazole ribonucleotide synthase n=1 Tax=Eupransor demetentiae TaxID=3109584 RepID=A0ABP0EPQ7_9LACO|nr:Phosphoribosylaminoimidazole carboxylase (NCAIR synthetase) (PurK) [Lactobacillaceae bacterium LMG 33000]
MQTSKRPFSRVGIIGGGQLGQMMTFSAKEIGCEVTVLDPTPNCPAGQVADKQIIAAYDDRLALQQLAQQVDYITYEFENVNQEALTQLDSKKIPQGIDLLRITSNRLFEKSFIAEIAPVTEFRAMNSVQELKAVVKALGLPGILKTTTSGYDGHGQYDLNYEEDIEKLEKNWPNREMIYEKRINFTHELSVMVARGGDGAIHTWPVAENIHEHHILKDSIVPARVPAKIQEKIQAIAIKICKAFGVAGVLGIEFFYDANSKQIWVNEIAPRPHNSGHYTIEACNLSQFAGHILSIMGQALPEIKLFDTARMVNLLGDELLSGKKAWQQHPDWYFHDYGKSEMRLHRKMGHITAVGAQAVETLTEFSRTLEE